jgi:hypothetical protein
MPAPHEILGVSASEESRQAWQALIDDVRRHRTPTAKEGDIMYGIRAPETIQSDQRWTDMGASSRVVNERIRLIAETRGVAPADILPQGVDSESDSLARTYLGTLGLLEPREQSNPNIAD